MNWPSANVVSGACISFTATAHLCYSLCLIISHHTHATHNNRLQSPSSSSPSSQSPSEAIISISFGLPFKRKPKSTIVRNQRISVKIRAVFVHVFTLLALFSFVVIIYGIFLLVFPSFRTFFLHTSRII